VTADDDDPFEDLGSDPRSAAERLEERDRTHPEVPVRPPQVPRPSSRYSWVIGIAFFLVVVIAAVNGLKTDENALRGLPPGKRLPDFAAPLATGNLEGDANVRGRHGGNKNAGKVPACDVRSKEVVNVCELRKKPLVLSFIFDKGADCNPQVDRVERMRHRFPDVNFAAVFFSHEDRDTVRDIVKRRGWREPVALDQDGQLTNRYLVGGCPTTVFAYRGGRVMKTTLGPLTEGQLSAAARRLLHGPGRRAG
jgi:AhpC/TSA family